MHCLFFRGTRRHKGLTQCYFWTFWDCWSSSCFWSFGDYWSRSCFWSFGDYRRSRSCFWFARRFCSIYCILFLLAWRCRGSRRRELFILGLCRDICYTSWWCSGFQDFGFLLRRLQHEIRNHYILKKWYPKRGEMYTWAHCVIDGYILTILIKHQHRQVDVWHTTALVSDSLN